MTPAGQNYPIHEHTFMFWGIYLGAVITMTILLLGLFLLMVQRHGQATRTAPEPQLVPIEPAPELGHDEARDEARGETHAA